MRWFFRECESHRGHTKIGPVLEVKVTSRLERYGIEIKAVLRRTTELNLGLCSAGVLTNT